jgi:hypothetical protein
VLGIGWWTMKQKRSDSPLPPNYADLPDEVKVECEEDVYRHQLKWRHACCPGDPRLTSMDRDGVPRSGQFGKRVKTDNVSTEGEE